jgi:hypothetical protein
VGVYVDPLLAWPKSQLWPYGAVSHLYADTPDELHAFARLLGFRREWCSDRTQPGSLLLHYDLSPRKRLEAVLLGAIDVDHEHGTLYHRSREERQAEAEAARDRVGRKVRT